MSNSHEVEDGPAILQLHKWEKLQFRLDLSEFTEAFISPTRQLLLLLSNKFEAILLPLNAGRVSSESQKPCSIPSHCPEQTSTCTSDVINRGRLTLFECGPVIPGVKSLAWGHCGDSTSQQDSSFNELLVVSGVNDIIVHAFCRFHKNTWKSESTPDVGEFHGKWVEWGPTQCMQLEEQSLHTSSVKDVDNVRPSSVNIGRLNIGGESYDDYSSKRSTKNWFCTFFTEMDTSVSNGKFITRFPINSSFPHSVEVVSFSIFDTALSYLKFHDVKMESGSAGTAEKLQAFVPVSERSCRPNYECLRVLSSSSHRLIGLVLSFPENEPPIQNSENHQKSSSKILVIVTMLYQWGMQWFCVVNLQDLYPGSRPSPAWVDFQFSDGFLLCLNASGLIGLWDINTGHLVANLDILHNCKGDIRLPSKKISSRGVNLDAETDKRSEACESETRATNFLCTRTFKRLMVAPNSLLFAVVDELGIVYLLCAEDIISSKKSVFAEALPPSIFPDCGALAGLKAAGHEIGGQVFCAYIHGDQFAESGGDFSAMNDIGSMRPQKRRKRYFIKDNHFDTYPSGFSAVSESKRTENSNNKPEDLSTLRRIFLPPYRQNEGDFTCLSPFGITRIVKSSSWNGGKVKLVHTELFVASTFLDERHLSTHRQKQSFSLSKESHFVGESIGCSFQGYLYLITQEGLYVVLPSISVSSCAVPVEAIKLWQPDIAGCYKNQPKGLLAIDQFGKKWRPWQIEILDRTLLYEGPLEADRLCLANGWDLKVSRMRRMQLALHYLKFDEIEQSLNMLVDVNLAEEGILRLLFVSVYQIFCRAGSDNEVALSSRLIALAAHFATKMIRSYGLLKQKKDDADNSRRLCEMAYFLEVIRNLQTRVSAKSKRLSDQLADDRDARGMLDTEVLEDSRLPVAVLDTVPSGSLEAIEGHGKQVSTSTPPELVVENAGHLALTPVESSISLVGVHELDVYETGTAAMRKMITLENIKDMMARWEMSNSDPKVVVKDALHSGYLTLAVLQLQLLRQDLVSDEESHDIFSEIHDVGISIVYDLLIKGETGSAIATLERLGDDIESVLRQLLLGTVRKSLRAQLAEEMRKYGYIGPYEWKALDRLSLIERVYSSCSFWGTFLGRKKFTQDAASTVSVSRADNSSLMLFVLGYPPIECGDIDGAIIGCWANVASDNASSEVYEEQVDAGYWACAAVWSDAWDQTTFDRIVLDQSYMRVDVRWESQLQYNIAHNDLEEIYKLMDVIPAHFLPEGILRVNMDNSDFSSSNVTNVEYPDHVPYICAAEELDPLCVEVPDVSIFRSSSTNACTSWLKRLIEQELAKKNIFLKEYWHSTAEIMPLLARAGLIINTSAIGVEEKSTEDTFDLAIVKIGGHKDSREAFHKLTIRYCTQYNLPYFLDIYLDHHNLVQDYESLDSLMEATGDCQWAKWLLYSRVKGREYEASFSNVCCNLLCEAALGSKFSVLEFDKRICTIDDIAKDRGVMAALATLVYAAGPMQKCLSSGSVSRSHNFSSQCTLENLRSGLKQFPTFWRTLESACLGHDSYGSFSFNANNVFGKSPFSDYLNWRYSIFWSAGGDTSLLEMLPCWFPKSIRRLVQLFVQGPFGLQSPLDSVSSREAFMNRISGYIVNATGNSMNSAVSLEASIQSSIENELFSALEEKEFKVDHYLQRGRALSVFNHLLGIRASKLRGANSRQELSAQTNVHSDVQLILAPLQQSERSILLSVVPQAIAHFEDSALVASCAFLLELCGLYADMLRLDVAALQRISSYYKSAKQNVDHAVVSSNCSALHMLSHGTDITSTLARALAEDYIKNDHLHILEQQQPPPKSLKGDRSSLHLRTILHHLEKASLPLFEEGKTCGCWLQSGAGDASLFRSQQNEASRCWNLVTEFCQMHRLPLSTSYLAFLANDNDWVGFLTEAQRGGYPIEVIIQVAAKEIRDSRLKTHILTVLRSIQSNRKKTSSSTSLSSSGGGEASLFPDEDKNVSTELFGILAVCEKQRNPGATLLIKARDMHWSLLAVIASCFPDVSPVSCLTIWLEITAARETSSIKVDDISSKISKSVGSAVEALNKLPAESRSSKFHYNRRNLKRRRFLEPTSEIHISSSSFNVPSGPNSALTSINQGSSTEERKKMVVDQSNIFGDPDEGLASLSNMVAVLCEQQLFLPLLRAFEMFLPSCSLLSFIRSLQAFSQMRLSEASAHLASFSTRIKEESSLIQFNVAREGLVRTTWISATAVKAADAVLSTCPSVYEKRCLLQLLAAADFADAGSSSAYFRRLYWKINLAEPSLSKDGDVLLSDTMDDASLLMILEKNGHWEQARNWAKLLESSSASWKPAIHHVTESQAEAMVEEWKEFLWDIPQERAALWSYCQALFVRYSFPPLQAGLFFLKHAEAIEKEIPAEELREMLLLSLQWLSGTITQSPPVYPLHLLREIETRVWLLAVKSEAQSKAEGDYIQASSIQNLLIGNSTSIIEQTASVINKMDNHINSARTKTMEKNGTRDNNQPYQPEARVSDANSEVTSQSSARVKRRAKAYPPLRRTAIDSIDSSNDSDDRPNSPCTSRSNTEQSSNLVSQDENASMEASVSRWEQNVRPVDMERAVLSLLEFGQITAAKQLQHKLSPSHVLQELVLIDVALKIAMLSSSSGNGEINLSVLDSEVLSIVQSLDIPISNNRVDPSQVLESLAAKCGQGCGRGLSRRIIAVVKAAKALGLSFSEAFEKQPIELLQLLSLKAQDSFEEAKLLVQTQSMPASSIARILAESFLKGLLAAHRGGYMEAQREEGPAPLLWRSNDFLKWAKLCPSESEIGHALMRLVMTGQEIPHACEVELLILSHQFYMSSACLDGVDVLVTFAANRVESYVLEGDFSSLARLIAGVSNFHALSFILDILIENGQLELLLQKYSATDTAASTAAAVRGFRMAVLTSLNHFNPHDLDAFAVVYNHFDMKHEAASLLDSRSTQHTQHWLSRRDKVLRSAELLEAMRHLIEAAEVLSTIDAGRRTHRACARASLLSLQIRIPDRPWIDLSETNARRILTEQYRFQEALIVAEAYNLMHYNEWAPVFWSLMLKPDLMEQFVAEFVAVLPLHTQMLLELAKYYRAEVAARGDQSHFSVWLSPGGLPAEWAKHLGRSFRSLLKRTRDLRVRVQLATVATGFGDVVDVCNKVLDKVPENAGPLILRRGHGGAYLPLM